MAGFCNLSRDFAFSLFFNSFMHFFKIQSVGFWTAAYVVMYLFYSLHIYFVKSCMTVSVWLYNEFSSRNLLRREQNGVMVQMLTLPFIFNNKCPLPLICDAFHRQKTFCTKDFLFFIPSLVLILYLFTFLSFCFIP